MLMCLTESPGRRTVMSAALLGGWGWHWACPPAVCLFGEPESVLYLAKTESKIEGDR